MGLVPEAANGYSARKASLSTAGGQPKATGKKSSCGSSRKDDFNEKRLSKKEIEELKKQRAKKNGLWW